MSERDYLVRKVHGQKKNFPARVKQGYFLVDLPIYKAYFGVGKDIFFLDKAEQGYFFSGKCRARIFIS